MIKKIKVETIIVKEEKEITSKKDGKKYKVCEVIVKVADSNPDYAGKWIRTSIFGYVDAKDPAKNRSATDKANYFKTNNDGKDVLLDVTERKSLGKDGKEYTNLDFKQLSKAQLEVAKQLVK